MWPLKRTSLLCTRLSDLIDGMEAQITVELLSFRSPFGALHRGNRIQNIIMIVEHLTAFWGIYAFALYSIVKIVLFHSSLRCFSIEDILDVWNF